MKRISAILFLFIMPVVASATPTISTITGTFTDGQSVTVAGSGYGTKSTAAPIRWAPFNTNSNADALGQATTWAQIQNMTWVSNAGYDGTGGMQGTAGNGVWTMRVDSSGFNWNDLSQKWYVFRRTKQNYIVPINATNNQKNFRVWPAGGSGYPNLYWSIHNGRYFVENIGGSTDSGFWSGGANPNTTNWYAEEIIVQASSANGVKDGTLVLRRDGQQASSGNIITRSAAAPAAMVSMFAEQIVIANKGSWTGPAWSNFNQASFDDIYVDNTWQRVMVGDASTYGNCRKFGFIVPTSWASGSVTGVLQIHATDFPAQTTAYAYVFDGTNTPNTAGKSFVIGGAAAGNPAPTVTSVSISMGSYLGGTVPTVTGTGFIATPTVLVGTQSATNVVMINSTSLYFTMPAHQPGDSGLDLKITNPDNQFGVLTATMSYDSPVANQAPYNVSAGDNWFVTLPSGVLFSGAAQDDGLPNPPAALTYLWQQKTGPGTITFSDATNLTPSATFSSSGTYTVTMTANDSALSTESSPVTIVVSPPLGIAFPWHQ